jgi:hypothetical protein
LREPCPEIARFQGIFTMRQLFNILCQSQNIHPCEVVAGSPSLWNSLNYRPEILSRFTRFTYFYQSFSSRFLYCWSFDPSNLRNGTGNSGYLQNFQYLGVLTQPVLPGGSKPPLKWPYRKNKCQGDLLFAEVNNAGGRQKEVTEAERKKRQEQEER